MDYSITLKITGNKINAERWGSVYKDSLKLVEHGELMFATTCDLDHPTIACHTATCLIPSNSFNGFWSCTGDSIRGSCTGFFSMKADIHDYFKEGEITDHNSALEYLYRYGKGELDPLPEEFCRVFGGDTDGAPAFMPILAIACMIASEFPNAAVVGGDLTQRSCIKACELAKEVLGREIRLPLQYDYRRLYDDLVADGKQGEELIEYFLNTYAGNNDDDFKAFLKEKFDESMLAEHFLAHCCDEETPFSLAKKWLEYGLSEDGLFQMWAKINNSIFTPESLVEALVLGKVDKMNKDSYDIVEEAREYENAYNIQLQAISAVLEEHHIERDVIKVYIPKRVLKSKLPKCFGNKILDTLESALRRKDEVYETQKLIDNMYKDIAKDADYQKIFKAYDVSYWDQLYFWKPGENNISPDLFKEVIDVFDWVITAGKTALKRRFAKGERNFILEGILNDFYPIKKETAQMLMDNVEDDAFITKYLGILTAKRDDNNVANFCYAMMLNTEAFEFAYNCYLMKKE